MARGSTPGGGRDFPHPSRPAPVSHPVSYTMGTGSFQGVKRQGRGVGHPPSSSAEVKGRVELYLYSTSGPSWPVIGWTLTLPWPKCLRPFLELVHAFQGRDMRTHKHSLVAVPVICQFATCCLLNVVYVCISDLWVSFDGLSNGLCNFYIWISSDTFQHLMLQKS